VSKDAGGKRKALGRGLGALIPTKEPEPAIKGPTTTAPVAAILPNPWQPRTEFADLRLRELAESIRQRGVLQPLVVRPAGNGFQLISGERRFRAAQMVGLETVPVVVREATDNEMLEIALIENVQREDLNAIEEARAYRRMLDELSLTQDAVAERVGKDRSTVANALRLLQLPAKIQDRVASGEISAGHARAVAAAGGEAAKLALAERVARERLSVRDTEKLAKQVQRAGSDADRQAAEDRLRQSLGTKVSLQVRRNGAGKVVIDFYNLEQLNGLIDRLVARR
jgi:ParB family chromosome partitioning protein